MTTGTNDKMGRCRARHGMLVMSILIDHSLINQIPETTGEQIIEPVYKIGAHLIYTKDDYQFWSRVILFSTKKSGRLDKEQKG